MIRLGVVSFLNARPLVDGLRAADGVQISYDVPAALADDLDRGEVDVALVPIVDVIRSAGRFSVVSDACIGCDGETMTVRVFSQIPPDRISRLSADTDSHTSVILASVLWNEVYGRSLEVVPFNAYRRGVSDDCDSVLLIGDKVVDSCRGSFAYEVDLGGAWRAHTGLPFVFAVWAVRSGDLAGPRRRELLEVGLQLEAARDRGVVRAVEIAATDGPPLGWPVSLAERYLCRCLRYRLDGRMVEGAQRFARFAADLEILPDDAEILWPEKLEAEKEV